MIKSVRRGLYDTKRPTFERDSVGYSPDGTVVPAHYPRFTPGNYALEFPGVSGQAIAMQYEGLDVSDSPFCVEAWINVGEHVTRYARIISQAFASATRGFILGLENGRPYFRVRNSVLDTVVYLSPEYRPDVNEWLYLRGEFDGEALTLYRNEETFTQQSSLSPSFPTSGYTIIGAQNTGSTRMFIGKMDEVRIWNIVPDSPEEIMRKRILKAPGLVARWGFDEGSGTIAYDTSGNGHHGTIHGAKYTDHTPYPPYGKSILIEEGTENLATLRDSLNIPVGTSIEISGRKFERLGDSDFRVTILEDIIESAGVLSVTNSFPWGENTAVSANIKEYYLAPGSTGPWGLARGSVIYDVLSGEDGLGYKSVQYPPGNTIGAEYTIAVRGYPTSTVLAGSYIRWENLQAEAKPYPTSFTVGIRDYEQLIIPCDGIVTPYQGQIDVDFLMPDEWRSLRRLFQARTKTNASGLGVRTESNRWRLFYDDGSNVVGVTAPYLPLEGQWTRITVTWEDGIIRFYINGALQGTDEGAPPIDVETLTLGSNQRTVYLNTKFNGLRIRSRAMTDQEISDEYARGGPLRPDQLTTYFLPFNGDLDTSQMVKRAPRWRGYSGVTL